MQSQNRAHVCNALKTHGHKLHTLHELVECFMRGASNKYKSARADMQTTPTKCLPARGDDITPFGGTPHVDIEASFADRSEGHMGRERTPDVCIFILVALPGAPDVCIFVVVALPGVPDACILAAVAIPRVPGVCIFTVVALPGLPDVFIFTAVTLPGVPDVCIFAVVTFRWVPDACIQSGCRSLRRWHSNLRSRYPGPRLSDCGTRI